MSVTPIIQPDVEREILRLSDALETATEDLMHLSVAAAQAEVAYRREYAKAFVKARVEESASEKTADALATIECGELLLDRKMSEALASSATEKCRTLRSQLDSCRTISANVRSSGG